jgi:hypothetical protein
MSPQPDDHDHRRDLDEEAAWREIVAHYGDTPSVEPDAPAVAPVDTNDPEPVETPRRDIFDRSYLESQELNTQAGWDDEGHFVPPPPPPLPQVSPRRKAAWAGLFGGPTLMLVMIVFGWSFPTWVMGLLVAWFVGGFLYLVATMPRSRGDGWSGDDGAVV